MVIAILSGKGGTGKTLLSVNLAKLSAESNYLDCDVEEPNGHLYLKPQVTYRDQIMVRIPKVDQEKCTACKKCVEFCNFNALAHTGKRLIVFEDICHSCGGCVLLCPSQAFTEVDKEIGHIEIGKSGQVNVFSAWLKPGQASGVPLIKRLLEESEKLSSKSVFIDSPPGSSCLVMESISQADYCLLVAEPSIFGAHNLAMVHELVEIFEKPHGVVLNKYGQKENPSEAYAIEKGIKILGKIPYDEELGRLNSDGKILVEESKEYREIFTSLLENIVKEAGVK